MKPTILPMPAHSGPDGTGTYFDSFTSEQICAYGAAEYARGVEAAARECESAKFMTLVPEDSPSNYRVQGMKQAARDLAAKIRRKLKVE